MSITEVTVGEGAYGVAVDADGVWTTLVHTGAVARVSGGQVERFDLGAPTSRPSVITAGPDDAVWFTRNGDDRLGRIGADGTITAVPVPGGAPYGLCVASDEALWFTLMSTNQVGRLDLTDQSVTTYDLPVDDAGPALITAQRETVWLTLNAGNAIGRIEAGKVTTYPLPTKAAGPVGIAAGTDAVWFVEILAGQAGRIDADGTIEEFPLPDRESRPHAVVATPDGGCWVTLWGAGSAVRLDTCGRVVDEVEFGAGSEPHGLALDPDGSVWVALETGSLAKIQRS